MSAPTDDAGPDRNGSATTRELVYRFHTTFDGSFPEVPSTLGPNSYMLLCSIAQQPTKSGEPPVILDLGCGSGRLLQMLCDLGLPRENLHGVDFVPEQIARARQRLGDAAINLVCAQSQNLPFGSGSVDRIVIHMSLATMLPLERTLCEIDRVLTPDGKLAIIVDGQARPGTIDQMYAEIIYEVVADEQPDLSLHATGDKRVCDPIALTELTDRHTDLILQGEPKSFELLLKMNSRDYLSFLEGEYLWKLLSSSGRDRVRKAVMKLFEAYSNEPATIPLAMQLMVFEKRINAPKAE
ncbi:class I SAM-dependent methyltransferase [Ruegeria aquimaris]|uniref:Class I SAM-dependent methyltransferase n=1 Tax=Ruegeria aquimaris TaxID=2984333 RepID=A0ABT3ARB7_9RHOB|nr:class I SAM-dependent methyltransferase [Ruegeria sp. XHP0148]MCV2891231.1 class I SAM-dependent methyltransferase [Ruegeria sp. XHP0148]